MYHRIYIMWINNEINNSRNPEWAPNIQIRKEKWEKEAQINLKTQLTLLIDSFSKECELYLEVGAEAILETLPRKTTFSINGIVCNFKHNCNWEQAGVRLTSPVSLVVSSGNETHEVSTTTQLMGKSSDEGAGNRGGPEKGELSRRHHTCSRNFYS